MIFVCSSIITFGLNALAGRSKSNSSGNLYEGQWDPTNARDFIKYTLSKNYTIESWELGDCHSNVIRVLSAFRATLSHLSALFPCVSSRKWALWIWSFRKCWSCAVWQGHDRPEECHQWSVWTIQTTPKTFGTRRILRQEMVRWHASDVRTRCHWCSNTPYLQPRPRWIISSFSLF